VRYKPVELILFSPANCRAEASIPLETIPFEAAIQRLLVDWVWNFKDFRKGLRDGHGPVIAEYDGAFAVDGAIDAYVHLIDYFVPMARIELYEGDDEAAADLVFEVYAERLSAFSIGIDDHGTRADTNGEGQVNRWSWIAYPTDGPTVSVNRFDTNRPGRPQFSVCVEAPGFAVECIDGSPDGSVMRIMLGDP
jgi:hypothetical protein